jgi:hypothetical protein
MKCNSGVGAVLELEVKTGQGKLSKIQQAWKQMVISLGGLHIKCQDKQDVDRVVKTVQEFIATH